MNTGTLKQVALTGAIVVGVTVASIAAGAFLVSPAMAALVAGAKRELTLGRLMIAGGVVALGLLLTVLTVLAPKLVRAVRGAGARRRGGAPPRPAIALPTPSAGRADRTPRAVQALAQQGAQPVEIAWRTGLPLDAVSLLLAMSTASRQLQPPTA